MTTSAAFNPTTSDVVRWIAAMADERNLALPAPAGSYEAALLAPLLAALSRDFAEFQDVVSSARSAARRNADQLANIVRSTVEQGNLVRASSASARTAVTGAHVMASAAGSLCEFAVAAAESSGAADLGLAEMGGTLAELESRLDEGTAPLARMRQSTAGVADFLATLARLSRHAQLLAVNASIEAAHLAEKGSRFAIVAQEVRKLSTSTRESRADVATIVNELRNATGLVAAATADSSSATTAASNEIAGAAEALSQTGRGIARFQDLVSTVADVSTTQSAALEAVGASIDQIAHHADAAASASRDASRLDLDALLAHAESGAGRWTLRTPGTALSAAAPAPSDDPLATWIADMAAGADAAAPAAVDAESRYTAAAAAVRSLVERANADAREILADVVQVAVAVSRNGYAWRDIKNAVEGVASEIGLVREALAESGKGARTSAALASDMERLVETIREQYDGALTSLEGALARVARIASSVGDIDGFVETMNAAAERAGTIMSLIETLSSETDLLSLNAAIEAAHAGEDGRGFSVIAEEIRALARSTNEATLGVTELVTNVTTISGSLQTSIAQAAARTGDVTTSAERVRTAIEDLRSAFESSMTHALQVSAAAGDQTRALDAVLENVNRTANAFSANAALTADKGRLELANVGSRAHAIAARRSLGTVIERVREFGEALAVKCEAVFEAALASGRVSQERLFDLRYTPITGSDISSLRRLFDVSRVPPEGFTPTKYATPWDAAVDEGLNDVLESVYDAAAAFSPVVIFISDLNGLFYAYPRRKINAWTNDPATDNAGNRIKRIFEDEYALRVGRWGLGPSALDLGPRTPYAAFRNAGCRLERGDVRPWGGYVYARDTSMVCNEVVLGLFVRGMRHSTLRICYDPNLI